MGIDNKGKLKQNLIGNEKDLKAFQDTNLGSILGFHNTEINDLHYQKLPFGSLEKLEDPITGKKHYVPPALIEEGFINLKDKDMKSPKLQKVQDNSSNLTLKSNPFLNLIYIDEGEIIN